MVLWLLLRAIAVCSFASLAVGQITPEEAAQNIRSNSDIDQLIQDINDSPSTYSSYREATDNQRTLVMIAAEYGRDSVVTALLDASSDVDAIDAKGWTSLTLAILEDHISVVNILLAAGANVNLPPPKFWSPLHHAANSESPEIVSAILSKNPVVDRQDMNGKTALHIAASKMTPVVLKLIIDAGADVNQQDHDGNTPLVVVASNSYKNVDEWKNMTDTLIQANANPNLPSAPLWGPLHYAASRGVTNILKALIVAGADVNRADVEGKTALMIAAYERKNVLKILVDGGADVNKQDYSGDTAMILNIRRYSSSYSERENEMHAVLMAAGADIELPPSPAQGPLHEAVGKGIGNITKSLLSAQSNVNREDFEGRTPILIAARDDSHSLEGSSIAEDLLQAGANVNHMDFYGYTALFRLVQQSYSERRKNILSTLLSSNADVNLPPAPAWTPLHRAASSGRVEYVRSLVDANSDPNRRDSEGLTPLMLASKNHVYVLEPLIEAGADVDIQDYSGDTALTLAITSRYWLDSLSYATDVLLNASARTDLPEMPFEGPLHLAAKVVTANYMDIMRKLIENNADVDREDLYGETPLFKAVENRNAAIEPLIEGGANVNHVDYAGETPIIESCRHAYSDGTEILRKLLDAGGDPNHQLSSADTALHWAAHNSLENLQMLLENGASVSAVSGDGYTPLLVAVDSYRYNYWEELKLDMELLLAYGSNINATTYNGWSPLHFIIDEYYSGELLSFAMKFCPDLNLTNANGQTVLEYAEYRRPSLVDILLDEHQSACIYNNSVYEEGTYRCRGETVMQCNKFCEWVEVDPDLANCTTGECNYTCSMDWDPVCGNNGITYENECHFNKATCINPSITLARRGHCVPIVSCVIKERTTRMYSDDDSMFATLSRQIIKRMSGQVDKIK